MITRRTVLLTALTLIPTTSRGFVQTAQSWAVPLIEAARKQIGVTKTYDPAYRKIAFPGGDVPREIGVCTDVVIRAYRDAFHVDFQWGVNDDMRENFTAYPKIWGLNKPDANIDHRRVPNLQVFFTRQGRQLPISNVGQDYQPGDIVTQMLPRNLPHIAIVSDSRSPGTNEPMVIHNIGRGTREDATLFAYKITGHYRWKVEPFICWGTSSKF